MVPPATYVALLRVWPLPRRSRYHKLFVAKLALLPRRNLLSSRFRNPEFFPKQARHRRFESPLNRDGPISFP
jgi:hypothetical protein